MTEDLLKDVKGDFENIEEVEKHDERGSDFLFVKDVRFRKSKDPEGNTLVIFEFQGLTKLRAVKISAENLKRLEKQIQIYRS